ncbi:MAG: hypothetical protein RR581_09440 [Eubacterium sp.]
MDFLFKIKKLLHPNEYKEYIEIQQRLKNKQLESSTLFFNVKEDPNRNTGTDPELKQSNDEANELALRLIELRKIFEPNKKKK